jgi:hypothetical protein
LDSSLRGDSGRSSEASIATVSPARVLALPSWRSVYGQRARDDLAAVELRAMAVQLFRRDCANGVEARGQVVALVRNRQHRVVDQRHIEQH